MSRSAALRARFGLSPSNARRAALGSALFGALSPSLARSAGLGAVALAFWRMTCAVAFLVPIVLIRGFRWRGRAGWIAPSAGGRIAIAAGVTFGTTMLLFFAALERTSIANTALFSSLTPVSTSVAAWALFRERPRPGFWAASLLALAGVAVVVLGTSSRQGSGVGGDLLALAASVTFGAYMLCAKAAREPSASVSRSAADSPRPPDARLPAERADTFAFLLVMNAAAAATIALFAGATGGLPPVPSARSFGYVAVMALVSGVVAHMLLVWAQPSISAALTSVLQLVTPAAASFYAWLLHGERLSWWHLAGGLLTLAGLWGAVRSAPRPVVDELAAKGGQPA